MEDNVSKKMIYPEHTVRGIKVFRAALLVALLAAIAAPALRADSYSGASEQDARIFRAPVWVFLEPVPGDIETGQTNIALPPREELHTLARFVMGGMVYGWKFSYTPSDRARNVAEYFELIPVAEIAAGDPRLRLEPLRPEYPRLSAWAEFRADRTLERWNSRWQSVLYKTVQGVGRGERAAETSGIKDAYTQAVLNAVREYARTIEKNKPKEINGEVLLRGEPRLHAEQGWFVANLRLYLDIKEIISYQVF